MKRIYFIIPLCLVFLLLAGCFFPNPHLTIQNHSWTKEYNVFLDWWTVEIIGQAVNGGNVTLSYAEVWAKFYDASDAVLEEWLDNINNLEVGETWRFSINWFLDVEPDHYELWVGTLSY